MTTISEIEDCKKHLQSTDVVRVVLNKMPEQIRNTIIMNPRQIVN
jgi:hypothetical protein